MGVCCANQTASRNEIDVDLLNEEDRLIAEQRAKAYNAKVEREQQKAMKELAAKEDPLSKQNLEAEVDAAFKKFDLDGDGNLNVAECNEFLQDWFQRNANDKQAIDGITFDDLDIDGNGLIDKQELRQFLFDQRMLYSEVF